MAHLSLVLLPGGAALAAAGASVPRHDKSGVDWTDVLPQNVTRDSLAGPSGRYNVARLCVSGCQVAAQTYLSSHGHHARGKVSKPAQRLMLRPALALPGLSKVVTSLTSAPRIASSPPRPRLLPDATHGMPGPKGHVAGGTSSDVTRYRACPAARIAMAAATAAGHLLAVRPRRTAGTHQPLVVVVRPKKRLHRRLEA